MAAKEEAAPVLVKVELKKLSEMRLWTTATVPIQVVLMREYFSDGTESEWALATTNEDLDPVATRLLYHERVEVEVRHRQLKCF